MSEIEVRRRLIIVLVLVVALFAGGVLGYMLLERWSFTESLFMTVITLSTVGFGEVRPLSNVGRIYTIFLILAGVALLALTANVLVQYVLSPERGQQLRRRRQMRAINKLQNHVIICGAGRVGLSAAETLTELDRPFIIIDNDPAAQAEAQDRGWLVLKEDATRDETLMQAGCERANGLLVCTGDDSMNLFIVLSARGMNPDLFIVSRSVDAANDVKLRKVGADKVISPYRAGGRQMANIVLKPQVAEFMEVLTMDGDFELWLEEIQLQPDSPLIGKTVIETDIRRRTGAMLVGILRRRELKTLMPDELTRLELGDDLIAVGTRAQLASLDALVTGQEAGKTGRG